MSSGIGTPAASTFSLWHRCSYATSYSVITLYRSSDSGGFALIYNDQHRGIILTWQVEHSFLGRRQHFLCEDRCPWTNHPGTSQTQCNNHLYAAPPRHPYGACSCTRPQIYNTNILCITTKAVIFNNANNVQTCFVWPYFPKYCLVKCHVEHLHFCVKRC